MRYSILQSSPCSVPFGLLRGQYSILNTQYSAEVKTVRSKGDGKPKLKHLVFCNILNSSLQGCYAVAALGSMPHTQYSILNTQYSILNIPYSVLNTIAPLLERKSPFFLNTRHNFGRKRFEYIALIIFNSV